MTRCVWIDADGARFNFDGKIKIFEQSDDTRTLRGD